MDTNVDGSVAGSIAFSHFDSQTSLIARRFLMNLRMCRFLFRSPFAITAMLVVAVLVPASSVNATGLRLSEICRVKGQETNTLQGYGVVVGLRGTGDPDPQTVRSLAKMMQNLGAPVGTDRNGQLNVSDLAGSKNIAGVIVTATVPAAGAQPGDRLNVTVNALSAKSLEGGTLTLTSMLGPRPGNQLIYAQAQGPLIVSPDGSATTATIEGGAKMEAAVPTSFLKDGKVTLVLNKDFASFDVAQRIEDEINEMSSFTYLNPTELSASRPRAQAIDQLHVEVVVPEQYSKNPIKFISFLLNVTIPMQSHSSRVVINERDGVVVIGKDVEIAPVLITHRNLRIEVGGTRHFVPLGDESDEPAMTKLKSLADVMNAIDLPTEDLISIIKTLKHKGDLYGEVVFQ